MKNDNKLSGFNGILLHPSLDIKDEILITGFRYRSKSSKVEDIFLVTTNGQTSLLKNEEFTYKDRQYFIEKNKRQLSWLEERWGLDEVNLFLDNQLNSKGDINPIEIFTEIIESSKRYVELEENIDYTLLSAWIIGTYFFPTFSAYPMLNLKGPKGSGKSQCLNFLKQLSFNAIKARPTLAALGDTVDSLRGTCLIDQADSLDRKGGEDLLDTITDSYKKSGGKRRIIDMDKNKSRRVVEFETYSPKAFASTKELPQDLRDRCLAIPLIRSGKNFHDPDEDVDSWKIMRDKLYRLLISQYSIVKCAYSIKKVEYRMSNDMVGRLLELWLPMEIIMDYNGMSDQVDEAKRRFKAQYGFTEYEPSELDEKVITVIRDQLQNKDRAELTPKEISELIGREHFWEQDDQKQRSAKVGLVIKGFNLADEKLTRNKAGQRYLFSKEKVEKIHSIYFKTPEEPTPIYIETEKPLDIELNF